jgi:CheY-like chemotaxis protein
MGRFGIRILIIEDERALTDVLTYNLGREGFETVVANDGQEGLRKAQTLLPDLIILDWMLPVLNGLEVCRELRAREHTRAIPIVMLSAKGPRSWATAAIFGPAATGARIPIGCKGAFTRPALPPSLRPTPWSALRMMTAASTTWILFPRWKTAR